jgi:putative aminopeptidase FrvX
LELKELLKELTDVSGVSGHEYEAGHVVAKLIKPFSDEANVDKMGNAIAVKRGFLRITNVGGIDISILPGQAVTVLAKEQLKGVIGAKPPHLQEPGESGNLIQMDDLYVDTGKAKEELIDIVEIGALVRIESEFTELSNGCVSAMAMDDRAGVAVLVETLRRLTERKHDWDVYAIATAQEEVSGLGAMTTAYEIQPDIAIAIDVTFGDGPGIPERRSNPLGKGPTIGLGPNFHPKITQKLKDTASENEITHQIEIDPYPGGTDAYALQVSRSGIPTGLVSIPLRNMHSTVETLKLDDVKRCAELLSVFISKLDSKFQEDLKCF